ncbi:membrane protein [Rhodococcus erythropolis]|nr:membrane protein [Rhodococcus erythropolis]
MASTPIRVRRRRRDGNTHRRRNIATGLGIAALVIAAFTAWMGYSAFQVKDNLEAARDHAQAAKNALLTGKTEEAKRSAADADKYATLARSGTHSLPWNILSPIPFIGSPLETTKQMSDVVRGLTQDVLLPAVDAGTALAPDELIQSGGRIALEPLRDAAPALEQTAKAAKHLAAQADAIQEAALVGAVNDARITLIDQTADLANLLDNTATASYLVPSMLGADGPRNYFIGFQTNAEARGTGGLLGGYGIIHVQDGTARIASLSRNSELSMDKAPIDLGPDFANLYGASRPTTDVRNSNLSSHFPYAAQIWQSLWSQESNGEMVDGAIAIDPIALSYILGVMGPITMPDGEVVSADNVVELTESTAYTRFAEDNNARKQYLQTIAASVVQKMTGKITSPSALLEAVGKAVSEERIAVWSSHPDEQKIIASTPLGHTVPDDAAPYANVVINNQAGNKLDYYLTRSINYSAGSCEAATRSSTVTVSLTNNTPQSNLPDYVDGMVVNPKNLPQATNVAAVSLLSTQGAKLESVAIDGRIAFAISGKEQNRPVFMTLAEVPRGETTNVVFKLIEPTSAGEARVPIQPLVDEPTTTVDVPTC